MADPTREEFDAAAARVAQSAPDGLSQDEFYARVDRELSRQDTHGGLTLAAVGEGVPLAARAAPAFAQAPNAAKIGGAIARGGTTAAAVARGLYNMSPEQIIAAPLEGWAAGKGGYWLTKGAQGVAAPVGRMLGKIAPYTQALSTLGAAQGVGDLAQMAEPQRKDIGFLGVGGGTHDDTDPALLNLIASKLRALVGGQPSGSTQTPQNDPSWYRADGSRKGNGFLGVLQRPDGKVSSEISIGVNIDGKEVEIPTLVPTLSPQERDWLINNDVSDPKKLPPQIIQKAVDFARTRMAAGKSPFAQAGESPR